MPDGSAQEPIHSVVDETQQQAARANAAEARAVAAEARAVEAAARDDRRVAKYIFEVDERTRLAREIANAPMSKAELAAKIMVSRANWPFAQTPQKLLDFAKQCADLYAAEYSTPTPTNGGPTA